MRRRVGWLALSLAAVASLSGCGGGLDLAPADGTVTIDGKPLEGAGVMFVPVAGGPPATGVTDAQGHFRVSTLNDEGAVVGEHRVTVVKDEFVGVPVDEAGLEDPEMIRRVRRSGMPVFKTVHHLPQKYATPEQSGLTAAVPKQGDSFEFALKSK